MENNVVEDENKACQEDMAETEDNYTSDEATETVKVVAFDKYEQKEKEAADYLDKLQRSIAEFDNYRKRTSKEKAYMYDDGVRDTIEKILPILDNFERALSSVQNREDSFFKGVEMILRQFEGILDYIGVEKIESIGVQFDPNKHNAVAHVDDENFPENEIIEEMQKGYIYKDKVIRYSMVKVAN